MMWKTHNGGMNMSDCGLQTNLIGRRIRLLNKHGEKTKGSADAVIEGVYLKEGTILRIIIRFLKDKLIYGEANSKGNIRVIDLSYPFVVLN
jgi:hypothetical protein